MAMEIKVCMGTNCAMMGNLNLYEEIKELSNEYPDQIHVESVKCLNACKEGKNNLPVISINGEIKLSNKTEEIISEIVEVISE